MDRSADVTAPAPVELPDDASLATPEDCPLAAAWDAITSDATLEVVEAAGCRPLDDARVVAAVTALMHASVGRRARAVTVVVTEEQVVVWDDGRRPRRRLDVLTATARDGLRELGGDLAVQSVGRRSGAVATITRPTG